MDDEVVGWPDGRDGKSDLHERQVSEFGAAAVELQLLSQIESNTVRDSGGIKLRFLRFRSLDAKITALETGP